MNARDVGDKAVATARLRLDERRSARQRQRLAQDMDGLIETAGGDGDVPPGALDQRVFGEHLARMRGEQTQQIQVTRPDAHLHVVAGEAPRIDVQYVRSEREQVTSSHIGVRSLRERVTQPKFWG